MNSLEDLKRNWEDLANADAFWAICTDPARKNGKWSKEEFFATGLQELKTVMAGLDELGVQRDGSGVALDFGCGVGRLTRAMAEFFRQAIGVDISPTMIRKAQELNSDLGNCCFVSNDKPQLQEFRDGQFAFIYSSIVLQHIPPPFSMRYVEELVRLLQPGGVFVFQLLDQFKGPALARVRQKLALRRRLQKAMAGQNGGLGMDLYCVREKRVREQLEAAQAKVMDVRYTNSADPAFNGSLKYAEEAPATGYISKQYVAIKQ